MKRTIFRERKDFRQVRSVPNVPKCQNLHDGRYKVYLSMIECPKYDWHVAFCYKRLCYRRATAGTFVLDLLYWPFWTQNASKEAISNGLYIFESFFSKYVTLRLRQNFALYNLYTHFRMKKGGRFRYILYWQKFVNFEPKNTDRRCYFF